MQLNKNLISVLEEKPEKYDLVNVIFKDGSIRKAWWNGMNWEGEKDFYEAPIYWKRHIAISRVREINKKD
jgi:hypothetical protein